MSEKIIFNFKENARGELVVQTICRKCDYSVNNCKCANIKILSAKPVKKSLLNIRRKVIIVMALLCWAMLPISSLSVVFNGLGAAFGCIAGAIGCKELELSFKMPDLINSSLKVATFMFYSCSLFSIILVIYLILR